MPMPTIVDKIQKDIDILFIAGHLHHLFSTWPGLRDSIGCGDKYDIKSLEHHNLLSHPSIYAAKTATVCLAQSRSYSGYTLALLVSNCDIQIYCH